VVDLSTFFSGNGGSKFRKKFGIFEEAAVYADFTGKNREDCPDRTVLLPDPKSGPNAARFNTTMMRAKRYKPIVSPMATCIARMQISQKNRVFFIQIKKG
jgi:hypothetical protein